MMKRSVVFLAIILILTILVSIIHINRDSSSLRAQDSDAAFVQISSIELLEYDSTGLPRVSIDTNFAYDCGPDNCWIWERTSNDRLFRTGQGFYRTAGFNDRYLFGLDWHLCEEAGDENAFLFDLQNISVTSFCWSYVVDPKSWSPFDETVMYVNQVELFDVLTQTLTTFSPPTSVDIEDIDLCIGNGKYLWDIVTLEPVARIRQAGSQEFNSQLNETIITGITPIK